MTIFDVKIQDLELKDRWVDDGSISDGFTSFSDNEWVSMVSQFGYSRVIQ